MTAKEKANELLHQMFRHQWRKDDVEFTNSKQCALVAVDEVIEEMREYCDDNHQQDRMNYWIEIKQEIEKL